MTYVVAWRTSSAIYIHADTVATTEGTALPPSIGQYSTFEESHIIQPGVMMEECAFKIVKVLETFLFGLAGRIDLTNEIVRAFARELEREKKRGIGRILYDSIHMVLDASNRLEVQLVLGAVTKGKTELFVYNRDGRGRIEIVQDQVHIGSLVSDKPHIVESVKEFLHRKAIPFELNNREYSLHLVNSYIQNFVLHNGLMEFGVGGIITGARLTKSGVSWPKDSIYVLYNGPNFHIIKQLIVFYRFGGVNIFQIHKGERLLDQNHFRGFYPKLDSLATSAVVEELNKINWLELITNSQYLVFFSIYWQGAIAVHRQANTDLSMYEIAVALENGGLRYDLRIHPKLLTILSHKDPEFESIVLIPD